MQIFVALAAAANYCSWRQTAGCDPDGVREPHGDRGCAAVIARGMSGFCECADGSRAGAVTCEHPPFACNSVCGDTSAALRREAAQAIRSAHEGSAGNCAGWRQTGECEPDGPREPDGDRGCDASIGAGNSGFCECYVGTKAKVKVREVGCDHEPFTCAAACAEQHAGRNVARGRPKEAESAGSGGDVCEAADGGCAADPPPPTPAWEEARDAAARRLRRGAEAHGSLSERARALAEEQAADEEAAAERRAEAAAEAADAAREKVGEPEVGRMREAVSRAKAQEKAAAKAAKAADEEAAAAEAAKAGAEAYECVGWRQTRDCSHKGGRDPARDRRCDEEVPAGASGSCECRGARSRKQKMVRASTCDHPPFTCADECARAAHYACHGWRQTGNCSADGPREEDKDLSCGQNVAADASGYCECGGGRRVARPDGCGDDDGRRDTIRCADECARGESPFEVLGLAAGARDRDLKQAFRRLSLKLHPDKLRRLGEAEAAVGARRFAEVRAAYDVVSDPDTRVLYEMHGYEAVEKKEQYLGQKGGDAQIDLSVSLAELYSGATKDLTLKREQICKGCKYSIEAKTARCRRCGRCPNEVRNVNVQLAPGFVVQQQEEVESRERCEDVGHRIFAEIHPGMKDGDEIVLPRMSEQRPGMMPGDVRLRLRVQRDGANEATKRLTRKGDDLHAEISISLREALLGFQRVLRHLDGHPVTVEATGVTKPHDVIKVKKEGMPIRNKDADGDDGVERRYGAMHVKVIVKFPSTLSEEARKWADEVLPK